MPAPRQNRYGCIRGERKKRVVAEECGKRIPGANDTPDRNFDLAGRDLTASVEQNADAALQGRNVSRRPRFHENGLGGAVSGG